MAKSFKELFNKYLPTAEHDAILEGTEIVRSRVDKEKRIIEVTVSFPKIVPKQKLYEIEGAVCEAYKIQFCKILPQYTSDLFHTDYIPEVLLEAERVGVVAKGFFGDYEYSFDDNDDLHIKIPFVQDGISLLERANTPNVIEKIIESEFGIKLSVYIEYDENGEVVCEEHLDLEYVIDAGLLQISLISEEYVEEYWPIIIDSVTYDGEVCTAFTTFEYYANEYRKSDEGFELYQGSSTRYYYESTLR